MFTIESVLNAHGITGKGDSLIDNARANGVLYVCNGCGNVGRVNGSESVRVATRNSLDLDSLCCEDADQTVF